MKKSIKKRIKITKSGKIKRRIPGLSHSKTNKKRVSLLRKKQQRTLNWSSKTLKRYA